MAQCRCAAALLTAIIVAAACGRPRPVDLADPPVAESGRFSFAIETRDGVRMKGVLDVSADTIVARSESAPCRHIAEHSTSGAITYECAVPGTPSLRLSLDRRFPIRRSSWSVMTPVRKKRDVCVAHRTWENGTQTCTRSMPEEYIDHVRVTGQLVVTR